MTTRSDRESVVIALGNRFRGDDGIGPLVAERLEGRGGEFIVVDGPMDALRIICTWENAPLAVVVDAAALGAPPGTVIRKELNGDPLPKELARCSSHGLGIAEAVALGKLLGRMPGRLVIYAVEGKTFRHGTAVSKEVRAAVEGIVRRVEAEIAALSAPRRASSCMKPR